MSRRKKPKVFEEEECKEEETIEEVRREPEPPSMVILARERHEPDKKAADVRESDSIFLARLREVTTYGSTMNKEAFERFAKEWVANRKTEQLAKLFRPRTFKHLVGNEGAFDKLRETLVMSKPSAEGVGFAVVCGPHGLGKSSAIECVANDAGRRFLMLTGHESESKGITTSCYVKSLPLRPNYARDIESYRETVEYFADLLYGASAGRYDLYFDQCETYANGCDKDKRMASKRFFEAFLEAYDKKAKEMTRAGIWVVFAFSGDTFRSSLGCRVLTDSPRCVKIMLKPFENARPRHLWIEIYAKPMMMTHLRNAKDFDSTESNRLCGSSFLEETKSRTGLQEGFDEKREQSLDSLATRVETIVRWGDGATVKTEHGYKDPTLLGVDLYVHLKRLIKTRDLPFGMHEASMTLHVESSTLQYAFAQLLRDRDVGIEEISDLADRWSELDGIEGFVQEEGTRYWIVKHALNILKESKESEDKIQWDVRTTTPAVLASRIKEHRDKMIEIYAERAHETKNLPNVKSRALEFDLERRLYESKIGDKSATSCKRKRE